MRKIISHDEWREIQDIERATWTEQGWTDPKSGKTYTAFPDLQGKFERERNYRQSLLALFKISGLAGLVVDIGCGPAPILEQIAGNFVGIGVDSLLPAYEKDLPEEFRPTRSWKRTALMACAAEDIRLPNSVAHYAVSVNALDHFENPSQALAEIIRILRPGGTLYLCFCINNASDGHPHPAHRIDLGPDDVKEWLGRRIRVQYEEVVAYGWRNQPAYLLICRKLSQVAA